CVEGCDGECGHGRACRRPDFPAHPAREPTRWLLLRGRPALSAREALLAQLAHLRDVGRLHGLPLDAGPLEDRRQPLEARLRQERGAARLAELALPERRVAVAIRAERRLRVVHVDAAEASLAQVLDEVVDDALEPGVVADVETAREHVAGVEADTHALVAA